MSFSNYPTLEDLDPQLAAALADESRRQEQHIELIASENYASPLVMAAQGGVLTNKYAEGYPSKRYYGGCEHADIAEQLAIDRARQLFKADFANVQPHSGAQANAASFLALCDAKDTILGMDLSAGGHLTHGSKVNFSGRNYQSYVYGINSEGYIDYDQVRDLARKHRPRLIIAGFSAYSRVIDWAKFRAIADEVDAWLLVDMAHIAGLVATGHYPDPLDHAHVVTSTTHKTLRGPRGGVILTRNQPELDKKLNSAVFPGTQGGPLMHVIAAKAVAFQEALQPEFAAYQQKVLDNAQVLATELNAAGFDIVSGGTDNHLLLVDLSRHGLTGKAADIALGKANITVNKNSVPNDPQSPFVTSGIRLGSPAGTTRGFGLEQFRSIASLMVRVLNNIEDDDVGAKVRQEVIELCTAFPVYSYNS